MTKEVLATIPALVAQGHRASEVAAILGVNVSTLTVRCSQARISLRVPNGAQKPLRQLIMNNALQLSRDAILRLRAHAEAIGKTEAELATDLLEMIAKDNLYSAVLDA